MTFSKRWIVPLLIPCFLLGGIVGQAAIASPLTLNSVLMNNVPCTVTISGLSYTGTCSGGFVEATPSPSPTPTATPAPTPTPPIGDFKAMLNDFARARQKVRLVGVRLSYLRRTKGKQEKLDRS